VVAASSKMGVQSCTVRTRRRLPRAVLVYPHPKDSARWPPDDIPKAVTQP